MKIKGKQSEPTIRYCVSVTCPCCDSDIQINFSLRHGLSGSDNLKNIIIDTFVANHAELSKARKVKGLGSEIGDALCRYLK